MNNKTSERGIYYENPEKQLQYLNDICAIKSDTRILDIGCGDGRHLLGLQSSTPYAYGIDKTRSRSFLNINFVQCDLFKEEIPYSDIDVAFAFAPNFGMSWWEMDTFAGKISGILKMGGYFILHLWYFNALQPGTYYEIQVAKNRPNLFVKMKKRENIKTSKAFAYVERGEDYFLTSSVVNGEITNKQQIWRIFTEAELREAFHPHLLMIQSSHADFDVSKIGKWRFEKQTGGPYSHLSVVFKKISDI